MKWLIASDLHLTDRPRDDHRFGLFKWMAKKQKERKVDATFILGDLTDQKDKHSSKLVNRLIDEITQLQPPVYILRGNHDCVDPNNPFFKFINCIYGVQFIVTPAEVLEGVYMIPHQRTQAEFDEACKIIKPNGYVMMHQTFEGAISETSGARLTGLSASPIEAMKPRAAWSGDVHKPQHQRISADLTITYVGAPFQIRFGDHFTPRVILHRNGEDENLYYSCPRKWSMTITSATDLLKDTRFKEKDQVKLTVRLEREDVVNWPKTRQEVLDSCKAMGLEVYGLDAETPAVVSKPTEKTIHRSNKDVLKAYCKAESVISAYQEVGLSILDV